MLAKFFSCYSQAPPELCGIDTTVTEASATEAHKARWQLGLKLTVHILKTSIPHNGSAPLLLIFPAPTPQGYPPVSHAMRVCAAYEWHSHKKVFLKDSCILSEGEMYRRLNGAGICNVPTCLAYGDVLCMGEQKTQTVQFLGEDWLCPLEAVLIAHTHHQLVLDTIGCMLTAFGSACELVSAIHDALIAHSDALKKAGILHCNLSPSNIIIYLGQGLLIDWDLSKLVNMVGPRQLTCTGTWQFMSVALLYDQHASHTFVDDLESSLYILLWVALMNIPSSFKSDISHSAFIVQTFNEVSGGMAKKFFLLKQEVLRMEQPLFPDYDALNSLLKALAKIFRSRYAEPPESDANIIEFLMKGQAWHAGQGALASNGYLPPL
ncbi:hypothetical protein EDC04DRAFT_2587756 [Pisolithus marmoratus]|nr:hypothetical protein EDC04DRAFT_2587756 [Pisolithus marmoratus]